MPETCRRSPNKRPCSAETRAERRRVIFYSWPRGGRLARVSAHGEVCGAYCNCQFAFCGKARQGGQRIHCRRKKQTPLVFHIQVRELIVFRHTAPNEGKRPRTPRAEIAKFRVNAGRPHFFPRRAERGGRSIGRNAEPETRLTGIGGRSV